MKPYNRAVKLAGPVEIPSPSGTAVTVLLKDVNNDVLLAKGATVPSDAEKNYAVGCMFIDTSSGTGATFYVNEGSASSCDFNVAAGEAASPTAYDDIGNPDANGTIAFAGYTNTWTSSLDTGSFFTISSSDAALSGQTNLVDLKLTDDGEANGVFLRCLDNSGADVKFSVGANGATVIAGSAAGTDALTLTAGDLTLTSGHLELTSGNLTLTSGNLTLTSGNLSMVSGDLDLSDGSVKISKDNEMLTLGASDATDSYLKFDGTDLIFYDSSLGVETTLTQLQTIGSDPTISGDVTISDGKLDWTNGTDEVAGTWSFANTSSNDIAWSSAATSGNCLSLTANALTTGSMLYLASSAAGMAGEYIHCYDGAASDFIVGADGATTIAGSAAGTDALTVTAGDLFLSDTDGSVFESEDGTATLLTLDNKAGAIADNAAVLLLDAGGTPAAAGSNILRINFTGTDTNKPMLVEVDGGGKDCSGLSIDCDPTVNDVAYIHSDAVIAADKGLLRLDHATGASAAGSALLRLTESATPNAGAIGLEIDAQKDMIAMYVDTDAVTNHAVEIAHSGNLAASKAVLKVGDGGTPAADSVSVIEAEFSGTDTNESAIFRASGSGKDVVGLYVDCDPTIAQNSGSIVIYSDSAGASGPSIVADLDSASPAADDQCLTIQAWGEDDGGAEQQYGQITIESLVVTGGSEEGQIKMGVGDAGALLENFWLTDDTLALGNGAGFVLGSNGSQDLTLSTAIDTDGINANEPKIVLTDGAAGNVTITAGGTSGEIDLASPVLTSSTGTAGTADGAIALTSSIVEMASDADGTALTLADGVEGQHIYLTFVTDGGGDAVVTPAHLAGADTTLTFADVGESAHLMFTNGTWVILGTHPDVAVA